MTENRDQATDDRTLDPLAVLAGRLIQEVYHILLDDELEYHHPTTEEELEAVAEEEFTRLHHEDPERSQDEVGEEAYTEAHRAKVSARGWATLIVLHTLGERVRDWILLADPSWTIWRMVVQGGPDLDDPEFSNVR